MAASVSPLSTSAEVKKQEKKDERRGQSIQPAAEPVVFSVDGRCNCCPYGYHIDLDFLNFCKNITDGTALTNLRRIQRTKRKLRKSMELMLQHNNFDDCSTLPNTTHHPDVVHSTEASRLINMVNYEQTATHQVLRDIDSSVNATLASIDNMQRNKPQPQRYTSSDSDDTFSPLSPTSASSLHSQQSHFDSFPAQPPPPPLRKSSLRFAHQSNGEDLPHFMPDLDRKDSVSSLSSVSTVSSEVMSGSLHGGAHSTEASPALARPRSSAMTSDSLAATMTSHFPPKDQDGVDSPTSPMSPNTTISKASLAAMKEAMAVSLQRMRDLEEQVKAIPILQVRISVLKEEKRLLALQLKAKSGNVSTCSVGVGEDGPSSASPRYSDSSQRFFPLRSPSVKTPPATLPKPCRVKTVGVGDHSVVEPYLLQPDLPVGHTTVHNQVDIKVQSLFHKDSKVNGEDVGPSGPSEAAEHTVQPVIETPMLRAHATAVQQGIIPRPTTRTIGVGDGNINDGALQIYEKELRTVIISDLNSPSRRNVGVGVKVPCRSVGVSYSCEDAKPTTRTVGINVSLDAANGSVLTNSSPEAGMLATLQGMLKHEVRSVGTNCKFRPSVMEKGTQHESACADSGDNCQINMDTISPVSQCTLGMMAKPHVTDVSVNTEKGKNVERGTATESVEICDKLCGTDRVMQTSFTNTDRLELLDCTSQTEVGVFRGMDTIKDTGSSTTPTPVTTSSSNTVTPITCQKGVNTTKEEGHQIISPQTVKEYRDCGVNTTSEQARLSLSDVECVDVGGEEVPASPKRPLTMQEQIIQRGASQAFAFLGSSSSTDSVSPTSSKAPFSPSGQDCVLSVFSETNRSPTRHADTSSGSVHVGECHDDALDNADHDVKEMDSQQSSASSSETGLDSVGEPQDEISGRRDPVAEMISRACSTGKSSKHKHSERVKYPKDVDNNGQGIYSGHRVGSVEDFMPNDMRRLMNLDTEESQDNVESSGGSGSSQTKWMITKTTRTVTTKQVSQDGVSTVLTTCSDDSDVALSRSPPGEVEEKLTIGNSFGNLSRAHLDLSKIVDSDDCMQDDSSEDAQSPMEGTESGKDSGFSDTSMTASTLGESNSLQGLDLASMGSLERRELKSIMKKSKSDSAAPKRGITFAESVVGGTGSSSEEEATESDDDSTTSYDEGSYDGREGDITYECQDDEAIAQGAPGAKMYDQNIRETYELTEDMQQACDVLANYLVDSTTIQTKELNANLSVVQEEWFRVSSHKLSSVHKVEDYLSSINEISHRLLEYIVNLVDDNGNAAIHYCVSHCNFDIVGLLLDTEVCDVRKPNKAGYTPTMLASLAHVQNEDHRDVICRLFASGDVNACAEQTGQTALMLATSQCRADMVQLLLEAGANCNAQDFDGSTALMCACEHGHTAVVHHLLAHPDCDATLKDGEGSDALSIAMEAGNKDIGVILYKHLNFSKPNSPIPESVGDSNPPSSSEQLGADSDEGSLCGSSEALWTSAAAADPAANRESSPETEV